MYIVKYNSYVLCLYRFFRSSYIYIWVCYKSILILFQHVNKLCHTYIHTYIYNRLPEAEPSVSKHVEDSLKIKILPLKRRIMLVYVIRLHYNVQCKNIKYSLHVQGRTVM